MGPALRAKIDRGIPARRVAAAEQGRARRLNRPNVPISILVYEWIGAIFDTVIHPAVGAARPATAVFLFFSYDLPVL